MSHGSQLGLAHCAVPVLARMQGQLSIIPICLPVQRLQHTVHSKPLLNQDVGVSQRLYSVFVPKHGKVLFGARCPMPSNFILPRHILIDLGLNLIGLHKFKCLLYLRIAFLHSGQI